MATKKYYRRWKKNSSGKKNNRGRKPLTDEQKRKRGEARHYWIGYGLGIGYTPQMRLDHLDKYPDPNHPVRRGFSAYLDSKEPDEHREIYGVPYKK